MDEVNNLKTSLEALDRLLVKIICRLTDNAHLLNSASYLIRRFLQLALCSCQGLDLTSAFPKKADLVSEVLVQQRNEAQWRHCAGKGWDEIRLKKVAHCFLHWLVVCVTCSLRWNYFKLFQPSEFKSWSNLRASAPPGRPDGPIIVFSNITNYGRLWELKRSPAH